MLLLDFLPLFFGTVLGTVWYYSFYKPRSFWLKNPTSVEFGTVWYCWYFETVPKNSTKLFHDFDAIFGKKY